MMARDTERMSWSLLGRRPVRRRESIAVHMLAGLFVGSAVLCLGSLGPPLWAVVSGKLFEAPAYDPSSPRPKAALRPFGDIFADQIGSTAGGKPAK
jgi:hypothetical protein